MALFLAAFAAMTGVAAVAFALITRPARRREGIRRLENYANHPGARRLLDDIHNQPREEDSP